MRAVFTSGKGLSWLLWGQVNNVNGWSPSHSDLPRSPSLSWQNKKGQCHAKGSSCFYLKTVASSLKLISITFPATVHRIHWSLFFLHNWFVVYHTPFIKEVIKIVQILDFCMQYLSRVDENFVFHLCFEDLILDVLKALRIRLQYQYNWESVCWYNRSRWRLHGLWPCSFVHLWNCVEQTSYTSSSFPNLHKVSDK